MIDNSLIALSQSNKKRIEEKGMIGRIWEALQKSPPFWGAILYIWFSLLGMSYSRSLYGVFDIDIFHFAEPSDFLLFALSETAYFTILFFIVGLTVCYLLFYAWLVAKTMALVKKVLDCVYEFIKRHDKGIVSLVFFLLVSYFLYEIYGDIKDQNEFAGYTPIVALFVASIVALIIISYVWLTVEIVAWTTKILQLVLQSVFQFIKRFFPYLLALGLFLSSLYGSCSLGSQRGQDMLQGTQQEKEGMSAILDVFEQENGRQLVRVTIRQDAAQPETRLPKPRHTFLVGTTSSFHFFYECEHDLTAGTAAGVENGENPKASLWNTQQAKNNPHVEAGSECKGGRPFIIPSANIASLEFIRPKKIQPHIDTTREITKLDTIINDLKFKFIEDTKAIERINAIITPINKKNSEANTGVEPIKKLEPESVTHVDPGQIVAVVTTFRSYLKGKTTVANLNEKIATFDSIEVRNHCTLGLKKVATLGPFPKGYDRLERIVKETEKECPDQLVAPDQLVTPDQFFCQMNKHFTNHQMPQHLMLIGRVDSKSLTSDALQFYGTQIKLAEARAEWMRGELLKKFPTQIDPQQITLRTARPRYVKDKATKINRAKDRSVEVWACGTPKDPE